MASSSKLSYYLSLLLIVVTALQAVGNFYFYNVTGSASAPVLPQLHTTVSVPATKTTVDNHIGLAALRIAVQLNDLSGVSGVAQADDESCGHFRCPIEHKAVPIIRQSVADILNRTTEQVYCRCFPEQDAALLNLMLRVSNLASSTIALQLNMRQLKDSLHKLGDKADTLLRKAPRISRRATVSRRAEKISKEDNFTYVPPPKTDVTPDLLAESLAVQPQDTATVGSIMPHFQDGVISYGVQLNGLIAATMTLNASTSLPCAGIGASRAAQPDLVLRPKDIDNGTAQAYIPDCTIIAANMYDPNVIRYWVMDPNGAIFSLVGSNKLVQINQLNSTASISLVLRATATTNTKRDGAGVALQDGDEITKRAMSPADVHTASMTAEACAAIKCNNNGGKAAVFNPFTRTCACQNPVYVEVEHA